MGTTYAQFGTSKRSKSFNFVFSPGVVPSVCYITTVLENALAADGDLRLITEGGTELVFRDCKLEAPMLDSGTGGSFLTLPILDRRWKWQFAHVTQSLNIPKPDGTYLRETDPQEIAAILLSAMGESNFDVSRLPNDARPECRWEEGARADVELEKLCTDLGCLVVYNWLNDIVELWPVGHTTGRGVPGGPIKGISYAPVQLANPQRIRIEAGNTLFQDTFECEAVGIEADGTWKLIDQLSYKPRGGWYHFPPAGYPWMATKYIQHGRELFHRDLAEASVYRCYRIKGLLKGGWVPQHMALSPLQPSSIRDIKLFDELADEELGTDGGLRKLPAAAYVKQWHEWKREPANPIRYSGGFGLVDATHGIIQFNDPVFRMVAGKAQPATVWYECSFHAGQHGVMHRQNYEQELHNFPQTPTQTILHPEVLVRVMQRYSTSGNAGQLDTNTDDARQRLQYWYDAAVKEYTPQNGGTVTYEGLQPSTLDGLTLQITWAASDRSAPQTTVSLAQRHNRYTPSLDEYRDRLRAKRNEDILTKQLLQIRSVSLV